jgi:hypothetical protein
VRDVWTEALTLHRVRYETRVLDLKEHEHAVEGATSKKRGQCDQLRQLTIGSNRNLCDPTTVEYCAGTQQRAWTNDGLERA